MFTIYPQNLELIMHSTTLLNNLIICLLIANYCICSDLSLNDENPYKNKLIRIYPINNKQLDELKEIENRFEVRFLSLLQINSKSLINRNKND